MASFSKFVNVGDGESSKVACYKFEGAAPHVALYLPGNLTLSVAV